MKIIDTKKNYDYETQEIFHIAEDELEVLFGYNLVPNEDYKGNFTECEVIFAEVLSVESWYHNGGWHRVSHSSESNVPGESDFVEDWLTEERKDLLYGEIKEWAAEQGWIVL